MDTWSGMLVFVAGFALVCVMWIRPTRSDLTNVLRIKMRPLLLTLAFVFSATTLGASCGVNFGQFLSTLRQEAHDLGYRSILVNEFFDAAQQDPKVLKADRSQGIFQKDFIIVFFKN